MRTSATSEFTLQDYPGGYLITWHSPGAAMKDGTTAVSSGRGCAKMAMVRSSIEITRGSVMDVGIRELRDSLSKHLAAVRAGRTLTVTDRGRPVARIVPVGVPTSLEKLLAEGKVTPATRRKATRPAPVRGFWHRARPRRRSASVIASSGRVANSGIVPTTSPRPGWFSLRRSLLSRELADGHDGRAAAPDVRATRRPPAHARGGGVRRRGWRSGPSSSAGGRCG